MTQEVTASDESTDVAPVLAVVGRPNVGKSTLVNRILGRREAVVEDVPGVTRDRVAYDAQWNGRRFTVVDTGGWEPDAQRTGRQVAAQAELAVATADVVLFVVDATVGATDTDEAVVRVLRRAGKPVMLAANKVDDATDRGRRRCAVVLGLGEPYPGLGPARAGQRRPARRRARGAARGARAIAETEPAGRAGWRCWASPTSASPACSTGSPGEERVGRRRGRPARPSTRSTSWSSSAGGPGGSSTPPGSGAGSTRRSGTEYYASLRTAGGARARPRSRLC